MMRLAAVVHGLEVLQRVGHRRERDVRAVPDFARAAGPARAVDDLGRLELVAGHLLDRVVDPRPVVRHVHLDGRRTARHDAEEIPFVHELLGNLLEQLADTSRVAELQVLVVHEEQEDAARHVGGRPLLRQDDPLGRGRNRRRHRVVHAAAGDDGERSEVLQHAVFVDPEFLGLQIRNEIALLVANHHVVGDQIDLHPEGWLRGGGSRRRLGRSGRLRGHGDSGDRHGGDAHGDGPKTACLQFHTIKLYLFGRRRDRRDFGRLRRPGRGTRLRRTGPAPATSTASPMAACSCSNLRRSRHGRGLARRLIRGRGLSGLLCFDEGIGLQGSFGDLLTGLVFPGFFPLRGSLALPPQRLLRLPRLLLLPRLLPAAASSTAASRAACLRRLLDPPAFAPVLGVGRRNRRRQQARPVEPDAGVLRFDRAAHIVCKREAADFHLRGRAEPEQEALAGRLASPRDAGLDDREVLVSASVARELQERHLFPLLGLRGLPCLRGRLRLLRGRLRRRL